MAASTMKYNTTTNLPRYEEVQSSYQETHSANEPTTYPLHQTIEQDDALLEASLSWIPRQPPRLRAARRLEKPVVIPRIGIARKLEIPLPFLRAYSHVLRSHDVHEAEFLSMIDNLAVAQAASPPLKAIDMAGMVLGLVPHHWAQAASFGVRAVAGAGTAAVVAARTKAFFQKVNAEYLNPRGLKASLKKDEELAAQLGLPVDMPIIGPSKLNSESVSIRDRRMYVLAPHVAPLTLDVPQPAQQPNVLDKMSAKQVARRIKKKEKKTQKKLDKKSKKNGHSAEAEAKAEAKAAKEVAKLQYLVVEDLYA